MQKSTESRQDPILPQSLRHVASSQGMTTLVRFLSHPWYYGSRPTVLCIETVEEFTGQNGGQ
ncbi:hypothetical protein [Sulfobacillus thermosulfidooxidans]|uniref:hypothetical protein n=1 Tax=Sulfobacillus thermosulfidooxidans TaxID=28034 RepID=UPI0006B5A4CF|nr:hypothetical protein [Sulfobacillus thermosulfidooxidans]